MKIIHVASAVIIDSQSRILLIKRKYDKKRFPSYWAVPWWNRDEWEGMEQAVIREVKEETGLDFEKKELFLEGENIIGDWKVKSLFKRYLWKASWSVKIQEEECDWYGWFNYEESKGVMILPSMIEIIEKSHAEGLLK